MGAPIVRCKASMARSTVFSISTLSSRQAAIDQYPMRSKNASKAAKRPSSLSIKSILENLSPHSLSAPIKACIASTQSIVSSASRLMNRS